MALDCKLWEVGKAIHPEYTKNGARAYIKRLIRQNRPLHDHLVRLGFDGKTLTPKMRELLRYYIGA